MNESVKRPPLVVCDITLLIPHVKDMHGFCGDVPCINPRLIEPSAPVNLHDTFDGKVWAEEFCRIAKSKGIELDEDWMHTWFANAIMAGYDHARREPSAPAAPDTRTIQDVLRLHVDSSQSMYDTHKRIGDVDGCRYQSGFTQGLERAIEVADNRAEATPPAAIEEAERIVDHITCEWCRKGFSLDPRRRAFLYHIVGDPDHRNGAREEKCTAQGRACVAALVAEGWGKK